MVIRLRYRAIGNLILYYTDSRLTTMSNSITLAEKVVSVSDVELDSNIMRIRPTEPANSTITLTAGSSSTTPLIFNFKSNDAISDLFVEFDYLTTAGTATYAIPAIGMSWVDYISVKLSGTTEIIRLDNAGIWANIKTYNTRHRSYIEAAEGLDSNYGLSASERYASTRFGSVASPNTVKMRFPLSSVSDFFNRTLPSGEYDITIGVFQPVKWLELIEAPTKLSAAGTLSNIRLVYMRHKNIQASRNITWMAVNSQKSQTGTATNVSVNISKSYSNSHGVVAAVMASQSLDETVLDKMIKTVNDGFTKYNYSIDGQIMPDPQGVDLNAASCAQLSIINERVFGAFNIHDSNKGKFSPLAATGESAVSALNVSTDRILLSTPLSSYLTSLGTDVKYINSGRRLTANQSNTLEITRTGTTDYTILVYVLYEKSIDWSEPDSPRIVSE